MSCVWKCFLAFFRGLVTQGHYIGLEKRTIKNMRYYKYEEVNFFSDILIKGVIFSNVEKFKEKEVRQTSSCITVKLCQKF